MTSLIERQRQSSPLFGGNAAFIEDMYERFLQDPESVSEHWRGYFQSLQDQGEMQDVVHSSIRESFAQLARQTPALGGASALAGMEPEAAKKQAAVLRLINAYRTNGHRAANLDPLELRERRHVPDLDPGHHKLTEVDMDTVFNTGTLAAEPQMKLRDILGFIKEVYTGTIGAEYMHINDVDQRRWIRNRLEGQRARLNLSADDKRDLLRWLTSAEGLEKYLHTRYVGQKRFSLEGGDSLIPCLDQMIQRAGSTGAKDIVIGMAHRGRLNVLVNILGKAPSELFMEFEGKSMPEGSTSGDVKYHLGFSSDVSTPGGPVHLTLAFNPSHLEIVNPVVSGSVRARMERRRCVDGSGGNVDNHQALPIIIHGDAAFAGQGVNMELLQMSQVRGYRIGGTVHVVVNNQVGFTISNPLDARSALYCTDLLKMIQCPVFHVNSDDPEAVLFVTQLALDYRNEFGKDVAIDIVCYRRLGHNEADEPSATQPMMYKKIKARKTCANLYADRLMREGVIGADGFRAMQDNYRDTLDAGEPVSRPLLGNVDSAFAVDWSKLRQQDWSNEADTAVPLETIRELSAKLLTLPEHFGLNPRVAKIMDDRRKMAAGALPLDWGFAENMAYATLIREGYKVRISGQDSGRGTFFHRHAVLHNSQDGSSHIPLKHIVDDATYFQIIDSILSEEAVLAFEYGYSTAEPMGLVVWEAQFGDFANGAQVVIDQFISSGEVKWGRYTGLTLLLPHGYEGQGPEHSSARLERFLQLCAEQNIQVCMPSTPAQAFHMLRRQMVRGFRKPLVVMSPKSLLRHKLAVNDLEHLTRGTFETVLSEIDDLDPNQVERVVFCSGKVYYDLLEARRANELNRVAILRVEQLYPFPHQRYQEELERYGNAKHWVWCQEEPLNQGAWYQIKHRLQEPLGSGQEIVYAGRPASASPAVGYYSVHVEQQRELVAAALGLKK